MAREYVVESYLKAQVEKLGGACEKHTNPGHRGDPDRLVSLPGRYPGISQSYQCLVETKWAADVEPEAHQTRRHEWWRSKGMPVYVICTKGEVDAFIQSMLSKGKA